jgi:hypothetical protein
MSILAGARAPEYLRLRVENAEAASSPLDLTSVTAVTLEVTTSQGDRVQWDAEIETQTAELLVIKHVFDPQDVEFPGTYRIVITMAVPEGTRRAGPTSLLVVP